MVADALQADEQMRSVTSRLRQGAVPAVVIDLTAVEGAGAEPSAALT